MRVFIFVLLFGLLVKKLKMLKIPPNDSAKNNVLNNCEANSKRDTHLRSLFQGDIAIEDDLKRDTNKGQDDIAYAFVKSETRIWLGGHVPYTFKPFVFPNGNTEPVFRNSTKDMIKKGLQHISEMVPCLTFRESNRKDEHKLIFTIQSDAKHPDDKNGCWSYVGKTTTSVDKDGEHGQVINLGNRKCFNIGTVIHEVLHSLGANHEQNNPNRNSYINILWENIDPRACNEFIIADPTKFSNYGTDYDVDSIMHYDLTTGSKPPGNLPTMELKDKTKIIIPPSKKTSMSITDIIELGRVYEKYTFRSCFTQDNLDKYSDHITKECKELGSHIISSDGFECISCKYGHKPGPNYNQCVPVCDETMCPEANKKCIVHNGEAKCTCHDGYVFVIESNECLCIVGVNDNLERTPRIKGRVCQRCLLGQKLIKTNKNVYCKDEQSECEPSKDKQNRIPNINIIGKGYNVPISNPFNKKTDRGFEPDASIFSPFSVRDHDDVCRIRGYFRPDMGRSCSGNVNTMVFFNAEQVKETIQQKIAKENNYKEVTLDVSEAENSQFTNSLAFGESVSLTEVGNQCKTNSHCVDRGLAENTEVGHSMENNGQTSNSRPKSHTKSNTVTAPVTAEAGFPGFGSVSATATVSGVSHTNAETNEQTSSSSNGWSQGSSSSRGQSSSINTNMCGNQETCETENREDSQNVDNENSNSKRNEYSISYRVPGFEEALTDSSDVVKAQEYLSKTSGSIAVSNIDCVRYEIALDLHSPPAFSQQFKDRVEKMDQVSIDLEPYRFIVTKIGHKDDDFNTMVNKTTEAKFDSEFSTFIRQFGTHFFKEVTMGAMLTYKTNIKKVETQKGGQDDLENCIKKMHQKTIQEKSTGKESRLYCTNKVFQKEIESSLETEDQSFSSIGGPLGSIADPSRWSEHDFNDPKIIDFKVMPIVTILNPLVMTSERISNQFGKNIHIRKIYSWFMPRYSLLINRCKSLSNHRLSDMGEGCKECSAGTVPTQDGMTCISIFTKCQSLENHKVSNDRRSCEECSDGTVPTQDGMTCILFTD